MSLIIFICIWDIFNTYESMGNIHMNIYPSVHPFIRICNSLLRCKLLVILFAFSPLFFSEPNRVTPPNDGSCSRYQRLMPLGHNQIVVTTDCLPFTGHHGRLQASFRTFHCMWSPPFTFWSRIWPSLPILSIDCRYFYLVFNTVWLVLKSFCSPVQPACLA